MGKKLWNFVSGNCSNIVACTKMERFRLTWRNAMEEWWVKMMELDKVAKSTSLIREKKILTMIAEWKQPCKFYV